VHFTAPSHAAGNFVLERRGACWYTGSSSIVNLLLASVVSTAVLAMGCLNVDTPSTTVDLSNDYPADASTPVVVYQAFWQAVPFSTPLPPGGSSGPMSTVPASDNTAYAVLAPGWDPGSSAPPTSFVALRSNSGFSVRLGDTLHIPVDDTTFTGDCATGQALDQPDADFITQLVFPATFAGVRYDAKTCTTTPIGDAGTE
jgi:hypothetical protein